MDPRKDNVPGTEEQLLDLIHSPTQASAEHVAWAKMMKNAPGIKWGYPPMDAAMIPGHPGDMITLVSRPGHGKTSLLAYLCKTEAQRIQVAGQQSSKCAIYISFEQVTEEIDSYFQVYDNYTASDIVWGKVPIETVEASAIRRVNLPVWLIGESISRTNHQSLTLYPDVIWRCVEKIKAVYKRAPTILCVDYLQLCPVRNPRDYVMEVTNAAGLFKELGRRVGCPVYLAVQARQEVDSYKLPIPSSRDGQWASRIFQAADKWVSIWRPWISFPHLKEIELENGDRYINSPSLTILRKLKERFAVPRATFVINFSIPELKLISYEQSRAIRDGPPPGGPADDLNF